MRDTKMLNAPWQIEFAQRAEALVSSLSKKLAR
jgi:hypothetical protein